MLIYIPEHIKAISRVGHQVGIGIALYRHSVRGRFAREGKRLHRAECLDLHIAVEIAGADTPISVVKKAVERGLVAADR